MRSIMFFAACCLYTTGVFASQDETKLGSPSGMEQPSAAAAQPQSGFRAILKKEALSNNLPFEVADAVIQIESGYNPKLIGGVGEIGLMQVRPETAVMLGFQGSTIELAEPEVNIHYGVTYLAEAWRLANGNLCRALMKYRAGWGEEVMTERSVAYCERVQKYLAGGGLAPDRVALLEESAPAGGPYRTDHKKETRSPASVYSRFKQGTEAASLAFWKVQEARVRKITARVEKLWRRKRS